MSEGRGLQQSCRHTSAQTPWVIIVSMSCNRVLGRVCPLEKEVRSDYERTMNKMIFDRVVSSKPQMFYYVTLPDKEEEKVPEKGMGHREAV